MRLSHLLCFLFLFTFASKAQLPDCQINSFSKLVKVSGNKIVEYTEVEMQINSAKGTDYAEIEISYSKGNSIKELEAVILNSAGQEIRKLKNKDITRANAFSYAQFHSDDMVLSFELVHNRYPYTIKYRYKEDANEYLFLAYWYPRQYKKVPVHKASLKVEVPNDFAIRTFQHGLDSASVTRDDETTIYTWKAEDVAYVKREKFGPQNEELQAHVIIIPEHFRYGVNGSTKSWQSFGQWNSTLKANADNLSDAEKVKVRELVKDCNTTREKVNVLYKYMQDNTRYINVSLDIGGLLPETAHYVCENKYGDCKALSNYMQVMFEEVGIHSIYTKVIAGRHPAKLNRAYPSQQFNHIILCVPNNNDTIWLECTDKAAPFNYLGAFTQDRDVLLVDGENSRLARTPALNPKDVLNAYTVNISVNADGSAKLCSEAEFKGPYFDYLQGLDDALPQHEKIDYLDELELFEQADIKTFEIEQAHRDSTSLFLSLTADVNGSVEPIGTRTLIKPLKPFYFKLEKPEKRTQELRIDYPYNICDTIVYAMPQNIKSVSGLKDVDIQSTCGKYMKKVTFEKTKLKIVKHFVLEAGVYPINDYADVYFFLNQCLRAELQKGMIQYQ